MFKKTQEDFICENCGVLVKGNGYTNHCQKCLWSKHVDIDPGDRASKCCGMMKPSEIDKKGEEYILTHTCQKCGHQKKNKTALNDDFTEILKISGTC